MLHPCEKSISRKKNTGSSTEKFPSLVLLLMCVFAHLVMFFFYHIWLKTVWIVSRVIGKLAIMK